MNKVIFVLFFLLNASSFWNTAVCQKNISKENIAKNYQPDAVFLHPEYLVYHQNDSLSSLYYLYDLTEFEYRANSDSTQFTANYSIQYQVFANYEGKILLDSNSFYFIDTTNFGKNNSQIGHFDLKVFRGGNYILKVVLNDLISNTSVSRIIEIDKSEKFGLQDFYLKAEDGLPIFLNVVDKDQKFQLVCNQESIQKLYVRRFESSTSPTPPPMNGNVSSKRKIASDSSFILEMKNGFSDYTSISEQGLYFVSVDSASEIGFTIRRFTKKFPYINSPMQMLMPLRYLCSTPEFKQMLNNPDKKKAVDDFWLKITGNEERARNQIAIYYNRVQNANKLFSGMQEGWMTDRGMIYIVFGPPEAVFKNYDAETWIYGEASKALSVKFNFIKQDNPLTNNDYLLDRSQSFSGPWNSAIEIWRR